MGNPRVLLADDVPEMLETIADLLRPHFDIVGTAQTGEQAIAAAEALNPDLLIVDVSMPGRNGFEVASSLQDSGCRAKVIFLTAYVDWDYVEAAFALGALGFVVKSRIARDLLPAIRSVLQGQRFRSPSAPRFEAAC